jgi:hypothetical protein
MEDVKQIETPRVNGYLDLDDYFFNRLGRKAVDEEDLYNHGLIELELGGRSDGFWILDESGNRIALFKEPMNRQGNEAYAELVSEEVSKILGMPTAHYDLAKYKGAKGVVSYNFIKTYDGYKPGFDIIADFYEDKLEYDPEMSQLYGIDYLTDTIDDATTKLNNLEDIWRILEDRYQDYPNREYIVSTLMNGLVDKLIFDILMVNIDDHCGNWGQLDSLEEGKVLAPQFDNARIINLHKNILTEKFVTDETIEDKELSLVVDSTGVSKPLEVLQYFLNISSSEYTDLVRDKVNTLKEHIGDVPLIIEHRTETPMPEYLKRYLAITMTEHLDKVSEIVNGKSKSNK